MNEFPLGFTKCPACQKYSINTSPVWSPLEAGKEIKNRIIDRECPYCFSIFPDTVWKQNAVAEIEDEFEKNQQGFLFSQILTRTPEEITPGKAKELAIECLKNSKIEFPPSLENIRVFDCKEEWEVDFKKIPPKNMEIFPQNYCVIISKKTGNASLIS